LNWVLELYFLTKAAGRTQIFRTELVVDRIDIPITFATSETVEVEVP